MNRALIVLGLVLMLVSVFGFASFGQDRWYVNPHLKPAITYEWIVTKDQRETSQRCGRATTHIPNGWTWTTLACALRLQVGPKGFPHCLIFSHIPEDVAKDYDMRMGRGGNLWNHELAHCGLGPEGFGPDGKRAAMDHD